MKSKGKTSLVGQFLGFSVSSWVSSIIGLIAVPIVTNVFVPSELGKINLYISYMNIFLAFAYFGMDQTYTRFYNEPLGKNTKKSTFTICIFIALIVAAIISIGILLFWKPISEKIVGEECLAIAVCLVVSVYAHLILRFLNLASRMQKNILMYSVQTIVITLLTKLSYVVVAVWKAEAALAIIAIAMTSCVATIVFSLIKGKEAVSLNVDWTPEVIKGLLKYGVPIIPVTAFTMLNSSLPQLFMKEYLDYHAIGIFSNAVTVASIITIIQSGFGNFWSPFVYEYYKTQNDLIKKVHNMVAGAMLCMGICIVIAQPIIYGLLVGKAFSDSRQIFPFILISPICYTISETLGIGIRIAKKTYLNIYVYIASIVVNVGLCYILLPIIGVVGGAIASAASAVAMLVVKGIFGERYYKCSSNYTRLIAGLLILAIVALTNYFLYEGIAKYFVFITALISVMLLYRNELKEIIIYVKTYFRSKTIKEHQDV